MQNDEFLASLNISVLNEKLALKAFDCGDNDINEFYKRDALKYQRDLRSKTYVLHKDDEIVAFYSVMNDKIDRLSNSIKAQSWEDKFNDKDFETSPYKEYPAVKIGRLGVNKTFSGLGIGSFILTYIKASFSNPNNKTGCRFITLDAYLDKAQFYQKNGFVELLTGGNKKAQGATTPMFYDLKQFRL